MKCKVCPLEHHKCYRQSKPGREDEFAALEGTEGAVEAWPTPPKRELSGPLASRLVILMREAREGRGEEGKGSLKG